MIERKFASLPRPAYLCMGLQCCYGRKPISKLSPPVCINKSCENFYKSYTGDQGHQLCPYYIKNIHEQ